MKSHSMQGRPCAKSKVGQALGIVPRLGGGKHVLRSSQPQHHAQPQHSRVACTSDPHCQQHEVQQQGANSGPDVEAGDLGWRHSVDTTYGRGQLLGQGSFGSVYAGTQLNTGKAIAIKVLPKVRGKLTREKTLEKLSREVDLLSRLQECVSVVALEDLFEDKDYVYLVTELLQGGDLQQFSDVYGPLNERTLALIAFEVLLIIKSCHDHAVIHGDVKPANFVLKEEHLHPLCASDAALRRTAWLKAIDFGCSQLHAGPGHLSKRSGTPVYMAPEIFARSYSFQVDMWSMGVMCYQLFSRRFPFWDGESYSKALSLEEVAKAVTESPISFSYGPWLHMSDEGLDFMQGCLTRDPACRLSCAEALQHPWLAKYRSSVAMESNTGAAGPVGNNIVGAPLGVQHRRDTPVAA